MQARLMPKWNWWSINGGCLYILYAFFLANAGFTAPPCYGGRGEAELTAAQNPGVSSSTRAASAESLVPFEEILFEIWLNGQNLHETVLVLRRPDGRVLVRGKDLARWRLRLPVAPVEIYQNESYHLLDALGEYRVDAESQSLRIDVQPENFLPSVLNVRIPPSETPQMPSPGGFFNYDLSAQQSRGIGTVGAQLEFGVFGGGGVGITRVLARNLSANPDFIRLESTWTMDQPDQRASLRLGDSINRGGAWGRPVRFGGIQWGTNFATQPDFISFPIPSLSGQAALPSTAELFVNNVRMYQNDVQPGPFSLRELPVVTGAGEMRLIVRDLLGREQIIVQPYYSAPGLLKRGLSDFSYEFGAVRKHFGMASNDYGELMFAGTHRRGLTNNFTGEIRGELTPNRQNLGLSGAALLPGRMGVVDAAVALSHNDAGSGGLLGLGFERQAQRFGFGLRTQLISPQFDQLGLTPGIHAPAQRTTARIGWNYARFGSIGIGYLRLDNRSQPDSEVINASYNLNLGRDWFLSLSTFKSLKGTQDYAAGLVLTHVLGNRTTASLNANRINGTDSLLASVQQNLPAGTGIGYRILGGSQNNSGHFQGTLNLQNDYGTMALEAAHVGGIDAFRASASGGMAVLGGKAFLSRSISDSFAVVRVPGFPNVGVYHENQPVARTDSSGTAFIPRLRPYQKNRLGIEQMDLPLDTRIDRLEVIAMPYFRSGYYIEFPVRKADGALLRIVKVDGKPIPTGAVVRITGHEEVFPVGLDGRVYVTKLKQNDRIRVTLPDTRVCEFEISYPETGELLPDLGNFLCQETEP
jgi:outer membrane usher protein